MTSTSDSRSGGFKRRLDSLFSPVSAKTANSNTKKKGKTDGEGGGGGDVEAYILKAVGMSEGMREEREELLLDTSTIQETVTTRMNEALGGLKSVSGTEGDLLLKLVPALAAAVSVVVGEVMEAVLVKLGEKLEELLPAARAAAPDPGLAAVVRNLTYANDRLEQYTRRESVRIFGVRQENGETAEDVETKALRVIKDAGVEVSAEDIAAVHRVGRRSDNARPVLVKFVSRRKRRELMTKKKVLKSKAGYERVFIGDDLTPLRARLLGFVKKLDNVEKAWVVDGRIYAQRRAPTGLPQQDRPRPVIVETPDDLFRLGVNTVDYAALGLPHLALGEGVAAPAAAAGYHG